MTLFLIELSFIAKKIVLATFVLHFEKKTISREIFAQYYFSRGRFFFVGEKQLTGPGEKNGKRFCFLNNPKKSTFQN